MRLQGVGHDLRTEQHHLKQIEKENGNPLQYSCLENPRDGGAWWAALYGVAQSRTLLKLLSSSSSSKETEGNIIMGKIRALFKKIGDSEEHFIQRWAG